MQIGAFFWPALLPEHDARWRLTNSEAGWITAIFYGAYMLAVPVLVTLTDRDRRQAGLSLRRRLHGRSATLLFGLFADGFWSALATRALTGMGWAGTYMTGLKLLADQVDAKLMSRAVTGHAASIGISGALSFCCADLLASISDGARHSLSPPASAARRVAHRGARGAGAPPPRPRRRRTRCSISGRCCATAPPWPMRWPTACTRWR